MIDAVTGPGSTGSLAAAFGGDKSLGKEAFLKLLVAQLQNQDPLKPMENSQFVAELAQFSNLEQTMGINDRLDLLALQGRGMANTEVVGLVGSVVTVRGATVTMDRSGAPVPVSFTLDGASAETRVMINDQSGRTLRTMEVGPKSGGLTQVTWDGKDDNGMVQPAGPYTVVVEAKNADGAPVLVSQEAKGSVEAVSFDKGYPLLHLDSGLSVPVADLLRVEPSNTTP